MEIKFIYESNDLAESRGSSVVIPLVVILEIESASRDEARLVSRSLFFFDSNEGFPFGLLSLNDQKAIEQVTRELLKENADAAWESYQAALDELAFEAGEDR